MINQPFVGSAAIDAGLVTRAALQSPRYASVFRDVFVPAGLGQDLEVRSRAAHLLVPPDGALGGHSAAALLGAGCSPENARAEIIAPRGDVRPRRGLVVRQYQLVPGDLCDVDGYRVTTPVRTAWDLGRRSSLAEAVVAIDALARVGGFAPERLLDGPPGARGRRHLARAVALADPRSESPGETHLRLLLVLGGLPVPEVQIRIRDSTGEVVARADLGYRKARIAIEYDGAEHFDDPTSRRDRARDLALGDLDWVTLRFTRDDVFRHQDRTLRRVGRRLAERSSRTTS